jgi:hypothetical protein
VFLFVFVICAVFLDLSEALKGPLLLALPPSLPLFIFASFVASSFLLFLLGFFIFVQFFLLYLEAQKGPLRLTLPLVVEQTPQLELVAELCAMATNPPIPPQLGGLRQALNVKVRAQLMELLGEFCCETLIWQLRVCLFFGSFSLPKHLPFSDCVSGCNFRTLLFQMRTPQHSPNTSQTDGLSPDAIFEPSFFK